MKDVQKIKLLEDRLHRLESNDRDNYGVCRRIRREINDLKKKQENVSG